MGMAQEQNRRGWTVPPAYPEYCRACRELAEQVGEQRILTLGETVLGKPILGFWFGSPCQPTLYVGGVHAQEWLTTLVLFRFGWELEEHSRVHGKLCGVDVCRALEGRGLLLVPALNLDGIDLVLSGLEGAGEWKEQVSRVSGGDLSSWQANIRGVDLNHNYNAGFALLREMEEEQGITGPAPRQYGGPYPHSEPETRCIVELCERLRPNKVVAFHSQGEEIFYRYGDHTPGKSRLMAEVLASSSGYRLSRQQGLASHGGMKDWFIREFSRPGFTVELGKGVNPLPLSQLDPIYRRVREMLMLGILL